MIYDTNMSLPSILGKEFASINKIIKELPTLGVGDDCAIVSTTKGSNYIYSVDSFVEDVHFDTDYYSFSELGEHCCEAALSDIAAMGGKALYLLISVSTPDTKIITKLSRGIKTSLLRHKVKLIGGDTTFSKKLYISITVIGECKRPVMRSGAKVDDNIYISSYTGLSAAGLYVLKNKIKGFPFLEKSHKKPLARLDISQKIGKYASSMIDISDGLSSELLHITYASNVSESIENIPIHKELKRLSKLMDIDPEKFALHGGEDFQLLYTMPKKNAKHAIGFKIGHIEKHSKKQNFNPKGYKHF